MGKMVLITTTGDEVVHESKKFDIKKAYELIGCDLVERIKVRYEGKVRDAYLDEEGFLKPNPEMNLKIMHYAAGYYNQPVQDFVGNAVIWVP